MVAERCSVEPGNGDPRVSVDGVEISIDDGTDSRMVEVLELLEAVSNFSRESSGRTLAGSLSRVRAKASPSLLRAR